MEGYGDLAGRGKSVKILASPFANGSGFTRTVCCASYLLATRPCMHHGRRLWVPHMHREFLDRIYHSMPADDRAGAHWSFSRHRTLLSIEWCSSLCSYVTPCSSGYASRSCIVALQGTTDASLVAKSGRRLQFAIVRARNLGVFPLISLRKLSSSSSIPQAPWSFHKVFKMRNIVDSYTHARLPAYLALKTLPREGALPLIPQLSDSDRWRRTLRLRNCCSILHAEAIDIDVVSDCDTDCNDNQPDVVESIVARPHARMELTTSHSAWRTASRADR